jgi:hypothetical protein
MTEIATSAIGVIDLVQDQRVEVDRALGDETVADMIDIDIQQAKAERVHGLRVVRVLAVVVAVVVDAEATTTIGVIGTIEPVHVLDEKREVEPNLARQSRDPDQERGEKTTLVQLLPTGIRFLEREN